MARIPKLERDEDDDEIEEGIDGLVHISDMSWTQRVKHPSELFQKGDEVEAVLLNIDTGDGDKPKIDKTTCTGVEMFRKLLDQGQAGDNVGILLRGTKREDVQRGQVLAKPGSIKPHTKFEGEVYVLTKEEGGRHTPFFKGYRPQFYFRTTDVTGNVELQPGTVIATFDRSGRYANAMDGSSHAAIYLVQNEQGIQVLDQWAGRPAAARPIPWSNPGAASVNVAGNYRVVVHSA